MFKTVMERSITKLGVTSYRYNNKQDTITFTHDVDGSQEACSIDIDKFENYKLEKEAEMGRAFTVGDIGYFWDELKNLAPPPSMICDYDLEMLPKEDIRDVDFKTKGLRDADLEMLPKEDIRDIDLEMLPKEDIRDVDFKTKGLRDADLRSNIYPLTKEEKAIRVASLLKTAEDTSIKAELLDILMDSPAAIDWERVIEILQTDSELANISDGLPILQAIDTNNRALVERLIQLGADVELETGKPLQRAIDNNNIDMVKLLLISGTYADSHFLMQAIKEKDLDLIDALVSHGGAEITIDHLNLAKQVSENTYKYLTLL